jgi:hypothetical protein
MRPLNNTNDPKPENPFPTVPDMGSYNPLIINKILKNGESKNNGKWGTTNNPRRHSLEIIPQFV